MVKMYRKNWVYRYLFFFRKQGLEMSYPFSFQKFTTQVIFPLPNDNERRTVHFYWQLRQQ